MLPPRPPVVLFDFDCTARELELELVKSELLGFHGEVAKRLTGMHGVAGAQLEVNQRLNVGLHPAEIPPLHLPDNRGFLACNAVAYGLDIPRLPPIVVTLRGTPHVILERTVRRQGLRVSPQRR